MREGGVREPRWGIGDSIISIVGSQVVAGFAVFAMMMAHTDPNFGIGLVLSMIFPWLALAGWPILASIIKGNGPRIDFGLLVTRQHVRLGVIGGLAGMLVAVIVGQITVKLLGPVTSTAGDLAAVQVGFVRLLFVLFIVVGAPLVEEIAFRGLLFSALCKTGVRPVISVLISALVFSIFHFEPERLAILFVVGVVLGELRRRSGSLIPSIVAHAVNNSPAVALLLGASTQMSLFPWH